MDRAENTGAERADERKLWARFASTGKIADYLAYSRYKQGERVHTAPGDTEP